MATIKLETIINAPIERVFDLSRSIELHRISMTHTDESVIAGRFSGLIELNETVTWKAKHFGLYHTLTVKITDLNYPTSFTDTMQRGMFSYMKHTHSFSKWKEGTLMTDSFTFGAPLGLLGRLIEFVFLKKYMQNLLSERNRVIKKNG